MELNANTILLWLSGIWAVRILCQAWSLRGAKVRGWAVIAVTVLAVIGAGLLVFPDRAGYVSGALFAVFGVAPALLSRRLTALLLRRQYGPAHRLARLFTWLHPGDGARQQVALIGAMRAAQTGDFSVAEALLLRERCAAPDILTTGMLQLLRILARWDEILILTDHALDSRSLGDTAVAAAFRLRALVEIEDVAAALALYRRIRVELPEAAYRALRSQGLDACVLALCGRPGAIAAALSSFPQGGGGTLAYWQCVARLSAGDTAALADLRQLLDTDTDAMLRRAIEYRLDRGVAAGGPELQPADCALLDTVEKELAEAARYSQGAHLATRPIATRCIALAIVAAFIAELVAGGATDGHTLWRLGALDPVSVLEDGQWWRLLTSIFLHFGWLHCTLNLAALFIFGPFVEDALGRVRYLSCYFASGVGSMLALVLLTAAGAMAPFLTVGASGAIMGIVGATGAILFWGWRVESAAIAGTRLKTILLILGIQTAFDLLTPQVCYAAHLMGVLLGGSLTLLMLVMGRLVGRRRRLSDAVTH